jgi:hypothetical protein
MITVDEEDHWDIPDDYDPLDPMRPWVQRRIA